MPAPTGQGTLGRLGSLTTMRLKHGSYSLAGSGGGSPAAVGVAGYFAGGMDSSGNFLANIDKITFATETIAASGVSLRGTRRSLGGFANSGVAGYAAGGYNGSSFNTIDKVTFPTDTLTQLTAITLTAQTVYVTGFANSGVTGYFAGGTTPSATATIDKIAFPVDTKTTHSPGLPSARYSPSGMANSGVSGYIAGGVPSSGQSNVILKMVFPAETITTLGIVLSNQLQDAAGLANNAVAGYYAGGNIPSAPYFTAHINKITFPVDTLINLGTGLSVAVYSAGAAANSGTAGYFAGGEHSVKIAAVNKITFSADTMSLHATGLSSARYALAGFSDCGVL